MTCIFPRTTLVILLLVLVQTGPLVSFSFVRPAEAVLQTSATTWSPFGPRMGSLVITEYSSFQAMYSAFGGGEVDVADWPVQPGDVSYFGSNPDFFLTSPEKQLGLHQLDRNSHAPFLGKALQTSAPSLSVTGTSVGCSAGFGQLIVTLKNLEESGALVLDPLNKLTASGPIVTSVRDDPTNGTSVDGRYEVPTPSTCMPEGTYNLSMTVYSGSASVPMASSQIVSADFTVNYNSHSTVKPTLAFVEIGRALSHLLDKPSFVNALLLNGNAEYADVQVPPAQGLKDIGGSSAESKLAQAVLNEDCAEHPWKSPCQPFSAYNLTPDTISGAEVWWGSDGYRANANKGYPGPDDIRAACDHFVQAGFTLTGGTCADLAVASTSRASLSSYGHLVNPGGQITLAVRVEHPSRAFGTIFGDGLNFLFGSPNHTPITGVSTCAVNYGIFSPSCTPLYYGTNAIAIVIYSSVVADDWNLYAGELSLGSTPDHLWETYNSVFSGGVCTGRPNDFPENYLFYCNPAQDGDSSAGEFSENPTDSYEFFKRAALIAHRTVMTIPVVSRIQQFVALNAWNLQPGTKSSLVSQSGHGFQAGFWSLLNMRPRPGYSPANGAYAAGGGNPGLIRRGFSQDVMNLSPFFARTPWELEILGLVYDSMLKVNPFTVGTSQQVIDWMITTHSEQSFNGNTLQHWRLRNDVKFHDGTPVTADDVVFSILAYRDIPSVSFLSKVTTVISAFAVDSKTVQVTLKAQSPFYETNIGGIPIVPKHLWQPFCTNSLGILFGPGNRCADPTFDPVAEGITVGNGPWLCRRSSGAAGGPCTSNGTQDITLGQTVTLSRFEGYARCCPNVAGTSLHKLSWADKDDDGVVNILDIADAALHFGQPDSYWDHQLFGVTHGVVDIGEIATIAFYFDHGTTSPLLPSELVFLDPQIDPFFQNT